MKVEDLIQQCKEAAERPFGAVILVLPWEPKGIRIRLCKTYGPMGEILNVRDGKCTARFDPHVILTYILKRYPEYKECIVS
jgi:hypothetical protein